MTGRLQKREKYALKIGNSGRGGIGIHNRLKNKNLSAPCENTGVELLKNGETCKMAIPCQAFVFQTKEGVETLRAATKVIN